MSRARCNIKDRQERLQSFLGTIQFLLWELCRWEHDLNLQIVPFLLQTKVFRFSFGEMPEKTLKGDIVLVDPAIE